jgi:hypothetical protein
MDEVTFKSKADIAPSPFANVYYNLASGHFRIRKGKKKDVWTKTPKSDETSKLLTSRDSKITQELSSFSMTPTVVVTPSVPSIGILTEPLGLTLAQLTEAARRIGSTDSKGRRKKTSTASLENIISLTGLAGQMLDCIESLHVTYGIIHGGITAASFIFGARNTPNQDKLFIKDFGYSCKFKVVNTKNLSNNDLNYAVIEPGEEMMAATSDPRYLSIDAGRGKKVSVKDDFESAFYVLFGVFVDLPWFSHCSSVVTKEQLLLLSDVKSMYTPELLAPFSQNQQVSHHLQAAFRRIRSLEKNEIPLWMPSEVAKLKSSRIGPPVNWKKLINRL